MAAYAALVSLEHIISNLQLHPHPPISLQEEQVESLTANVTFLQQFLEGYNPQLSYSTEADPLEIRIAEAAYAAEDVIESHIVDQITSDGGNTNSDSLYVAVDKVLEEISLIGKEAVGIRNQLQRCSTPSDSSRSSYVKVKEKRSMVGADDLMLQMKDKLTSHCRDLLIMPIVGMGGTGKTTLARNIYQDRLIKEYFDIRAWATISQEYSIREIFAEVLSQLGVGEDLSEDDVGKNLHKHLYGRKYMIIIDDMWSIDAWDRVKNFFPDNKNGSRVVVTTRLSNLASELSSSSSLEMKLLDEDNSWDLLSKTVFGGESCPIEFEEIGKKIAKTCKGLPLSIVVVGGLLAKSKHTREFWEYLKENLNSIVNSEDNERCLKILHLSYKQLPVHLKPCFLYMGIFPQDKVIQISRHLKLWVAEGFLKPIIGKRLEEIAKEYLEDLIDRNLVMIDRVGVTGNIKSCKVHDLLRDLCLREGQKERFYTNSPQGRGNGERRILVSRTTSMNALSSVSSVVRSLTWVDYREEEAPPINFRFLRILGSWIFVENMHEVVNLRFLNFYAEPKCKIPSSITLLWNLQTLIVDGRVGFTDPTHIWCMPLIRHIQFIQLFLPDPPNGRDDITLGNLQSLEQICNFKCSEQVVRRILNIKKLKISNEGVDDDRYTLSNLDCLGKLESLNCRFTGAMDPSRPNSLRSLINFPHSLIKLSIRIGESRCWEDILDKIGWLPLLQKLKLVEGSFKEGQWETTEGQFSSLRVLRLLRCKSLKVWTAESSHFPCLEHLRLRQIEELEEIPSDFAEISTLRVMHVEYCSRSAMVSAKWILETREELYGEEAALQVEVHDLWENEETKSLASPNFRVTFVRVMGPPRSLSRRKL